jgi:hypothetical protein
MEACVPGNGSCRTAIREVTKQGLGSHLMQKRRQIACVHGQAMILCDLYVSVRQAPRPRTFAKDSEDEYHHYLFIAMVVRTRDRFDVSSCC